MNMLNTKRGRKHIVVSLENYEKLRRLGCVADSLNDVITLLLEKRGIHD